MMYYENKQFFATQNETGTRKEFSDEFVENFMQQVLNGNNDIGEDENGNPIIIETNAIEEEKKLKEIDTLLLNLQQTDYVANKIAEANANYIITEDKTELQELLIKYSDILEQRKIWRQEIDNFKNIQENIENQLTDPEQ